MLRLLGSAVSGSPTVVRGAVVGVVALTFGIGLTACGGSDSASKQEIREAEHRGERRGRVDRMENEKQRRLESEIKAIRKGQQDTPPAGVTPSTGGSGSAPPESERSSCGGSLSVGPETSCPFAENVRAAYEGEIGSGSGTGYAYSPANNEVYEMFCTGAPHECTGAISASVFFP